MPKKGNEYDHSACIDKSRSIDLGRREREHSLWALFVDAVIKQIDNNYQISLIGFESRIAFGRLRFLKAFQPIDDLFARQGDETELILCDAASFDSLLPEKRKQDLYCGYG